jgi:hypothetical protein
MREDLKLWRKNLSGEKRAEEFRCATGNAVGEASPWFLPLSKP